MTSIGLFPRCDRGDPGPHLVRAHARGTADAAWAHAGDVGREIGACASTVGAWEHARRRPTVFQVRALARVLAVPEHVVASAVGTDPGSLSSARVTGMPLSVLLSERRRDLGFAATQADGWWGSRAARSRGGNADQRARVRGS